MHLVVMCTCVHAYGICRDHRVTGCCCGIQSLLLCRPQDAIVAIVCGWSWTAAGCAGHHATSIVTKFIHSFVSADVNRAATWNIWFSKAAPHNKAAPYRCVLVHKIVIV